MNKTKGWVLAAGMAATIAAGAMVAVTGHDGAEPQSPPSVQANAPFAATQQAPATVGAGSSSPDAAVTGNGPTASPEQVQQVLLGVLAGVMTPVDGQLKSVTPAEIDGRVRAELAKIGLQP